MVFEDKMKLERHFGRNEGIKIGEIKMLIKLVDVGKIDIAEAATMAEVSVEEFKRYIEDKEQII